MNPPISRLLIDEQHNIWLLKDNTKIAVKMSPLCKALYFLFLKHTIGITLYDLHVHEAELLDIYKDISRRNDFKAMKKSISNLVNRNENSFHEKCARIKATFTQVVPLNILDLYYIKGERGNEKKILLPRKFVIRND